MLIDGNAELNYRLARSLAVLLGKDKDESKDIFEKCKKIYNARSKYLHEGQTKNIYPEIQFLMINATDGNRETVDGAKAYIQEQEFDFEVLFDTKREAVSAYYVTSFPTTYFIDKSGALIARGSGMMDLNTLEKGIKMISE